MFQKIIGTFNLNGRIWIMIIFDKEVVGRKVL
ncbi:hypothetical protein HNP38_002402 [Chryseobacterium defluvii]|uniref:Uncharacterized protein n=1 Tax=Chryseobacterium defluvii TaxID=160396 RepID=A0A840KGF6_9FLAO|nr:hypothetical protein [Chryseobacterium defluvii]